MKKVLILSISIIIGSLIIGNSILRKNNYDVNRDGEVNYQDLLLLRQELIENKYDVNGDGKVSSKDYIEIKNYIMSQE